MATKDFELDLKNCYNGNQNLKRAGIELSYTEDQILDIIKSKEDMNHFFENHVKIISLDDGVVNFNPYLYQKDILKVFKDNRFSICLTSRQMGKCVNEDTAISIHDTMTGNYEKITIGELFRRCSEESYQDVFQAT